MKPTLWGGERNLGIAQEDKEAARSVPGQGRHWGQIHVHWQELKSSRARASIAEGLTI